MTTPWWTIALAIVLGVWRLVVLPLLQNEVVGWCEWLARWLLRRAVRRLPQTQQARWEEEWRSDLEQLPTTLARLGWALGLRVHAAKQAALVPDDPAQQPGALARVPRTLVINGVAFAVFAVVSVLAWIGLETTVPSITDLLSDLAQVVAALLAAAACMHAAHRPRSGVDRAWIASRRAWRLLGWAALAWGLGQVLWTMQELRLPNGTSVPVPSLADVGYLTALPLLIAGVLAFPTAPLGVRLRSLLDGLLVAASLLLLGWATVLGDAFRNQGPSSTLERAVCLAYPVGDIVAGTVALLLLVRSRSRGNGYLAMIGVAVSSLLVSDLGFAYAKPLGGYGTGDLADVGWVVGWLLLFVTALKLAASAPEHSKSHSRL